MARSQSSNSLEVEARPPAFSVQLPTPNEHKPIRQFVRRPRAHAQVKPRRSLRVLKDVRAPLYYVPPRRGAQLTGPLAPKTFAHLSLVSTNESNTS